MPKVRLMLGSGPRFDKWDGTIGTSFSKGSGTADDPYLVSSCKEFAYLINSINAGTNFAGKYFKQTENLDFKFLDFPNSVDASKFFKGSYDGDYKVIDRLEHNGFGLFKTISAGAQVKNLILTNINLSIRQDTPDCFGVLSCRLHDRSIISNCFFYNIKVQKEGNWLESQERTLCIVGRIDEPNSGNTSKIINSVIFNFCATGFTKLRLNGFCGYVGGWSHSSGCYDCYISGKYENSSTYLSNCIGATMNYGNVARCGVYLQGSFNNLFANAPYDTGTNTNYFDNTSISYVNGSNEGKTGMTRTEQSSGSFIISDQYEAKAPSGNTRYYPQLKVFKNNKSRYVCKLSEMSVKITV